MRTAVLWIRSGRLHAAANATNASGRIRFGQVVVTRRPWSSCRADHFGKHAVHRHGQGRPVTHHSAAKAGDDPLASSTTSSKSVEKKMIVSPSTASVRNSR